MNEILKSIKGGLIVSCQARPGNPLRGSDHMAAMAAAAELGGAVAIRADSPKEISEIKRRTKLPVIGIYKTTPSPDLPYITPDFEHAEAIAKCGVEIIALDATNRPREDGTDVYELISRIKNELGVMVMADISTFEEGVVAWKAGTDLVATTLNGYTTYSPLTDGPNLELVRQLASAIDVPVIAEGRFTTPEHLSQGLKAGAHAVVIGKAITNVQFITEKFISGAGI